MVVVRTLFRDPRCRSVLLATVTLVLLATTVVGSGSIGAPSAHASSFASRLSTSGGGTRDSGSASTIEELGSVPSEVVVGAPATFAWQALDAQGARVNDFSVDAELSVVGTTNGSAVAAWANVSGIGSLPRAANGTFSVPAAAWNAGVLTVSVSVAAAVPVTVRLFGSLLPALPAPVALTILPDLDHLVLFAPSFESGNASGRWNHTYWHVRDRFGDPTPGAFLVVEYSTGGSVSETLVPVTWTNGGTTGAWVNYSAPGPGSGTVTVRDEANATLLGPIAVPALAPVSSSLSGAVPLSPFALIAVALLVVGAVGGMGTLLYGGRARPRAARTDEEDELRRLAEGRATVVEIVRRAGALGMREIEAAWEPPPAPPAVADWVASLVTDGTLTVTLGDGGRALFSLPKREKREPLVTLDEEALERGIARRDEESERDDDTDL